MRFVGNALFERRREARFANPRFTRDQHDLTLTFPGEVLALREEIDFLLSRPMRFDRPAVWTAAKRLSEADTPSIAQAAIGSENP